MVIWPSAYSAGRSLQARATEFHYYVLSATQVPDWTVARTFFDLTLDGVLLPGKEIANAIEPFILEYEKESHGSGQDNWYDTVWWIAVLLFSDDPRVGVERIRRLPPDRTRSSRAASGARSS